MNLHKERKGQKRRKIISKKKELEKNGTSNGMKDDQKIKQDFFFS